MKTKIVKLIFTLLFSLIFAILLTGKVFGTVNQYNQPVDTSLGGLPGASVEEAYCVEVGDTYSLNTWITYAVTHDDDAEIEPSVGYAAYLAKMKKDIYLVNDKATYGTKGAKAIQQIVWASDQWGTKENKEKIKTLGINRQANSHWAQTRPENAKKYESDVRALMNRSFQYGTVYYGLLYDNKNIFNIEQNDIKVLVDRVGGTYTVGPYKLKVKDKYKDGFDSPLNSANDTNKYHYNPVQILYNELNKSGNENYEEQYSFARFKEITGINGTDAKFINANGKEIKFPNFIPGKEEEFYIQFKPKYNGSITETGTPVISIEYVTMFKGVKATGDADAAVIDEGDERNKKKITYKDLKIGGKSIEAFAKSYVKSYDKLSNTQKGKKNNYKKIGTDENGNEIGILTWEGEADYNFKIKHPDDRDGVHTVKFPVKLEIQVTKKDYNESEQIKVVTNYINKDIDKVVKEVYSKSKNEFLRDGWHPDHVRSSIKNSIKNDIEKAVKETDTAKQKKILKEAIEKAVDEVKIPSIGQPNYDKNEKSSKSNTEITSSVSNEINANALSSEASQRLLGAGDASWIDEWESNNKEVKKKLVNNTDNYVSVIGDSKLNHTIYNKLVSVDVKEDKDDKEYKRIYDDGKEGYIVVTVQKILKKVKNVIQNWVYIDTSEVYPVKPGEVINPDEDMGKVTLNGAPIDMQIGGTVWLEGVENKTGNYNGRYKANNDDNDSPFAGIQVDLYQADGTLVTTTTTDKDGKYRFYGSKKILENGGELKATGVQHFESIINPLKQYYVVFYYDGQRYQPTYYKNSLAKPGGFSNARENNGTRESYNMRFKEISSGNLNYQVTQSPSNPDANGTALVWRRAYGMDHKISKDDGSYATTGEKNEEGKDIALTYEDVYKKFLELATSGEVGEPTQGDNNKIWTSKSYAEILDDSGDLKAWLAEKGVQNEFDSIRKFIEDSLMKAATDKNEKDERVLYPKYDKFVVKDLYNTNSSDYKSDTTKTVKVGDKYTYLYSKNYDMARYTDFGLCNRVKADIRLQKDVYKTTLIVNGKKEEYFYDKRDLNEASNSWDVRARASDSLYNGTTVYNREVRASDYSLDDKKLQAYVTYKIAFKNAGDVNVKVNEIVDHYDADNYTYDGNNTIISDNTFIGKSDGNKIKDLTVSSKGLHERTRSEEVKLMADGYKYEDLYLTGMNDILTPGNVSFVYVTFKVNEGERGKIKLDYSNDPYTTKTEELQFSTGKRNIAEINDYETYYTGNGDNKKFEIPNYLNSVKDKDGKITGYELVNRDVSGKEAGLIDNDSNPGSLSKFDLDKNGNLKIEKTSKVIEGKAGLTANDRQEDDSSQSPNIRIIINNEDGEIRKLSGYVFDDIRNLNNDETGNATIGNGQYDDGETKVNGVKVELVELISEVDANGLATGEYLGEKVWSSYTYNAESSELTESDNSRYNSGDGKTKIIINGPEGTVFEVKDTEKLEYNDGNYVFKSLPAGDFYVRFTYGDDDGTVLTSNADSDVNKVLGTAGRNEKSYNGQDYKSTIYQKGINQGNETYGEYNGIKGYIDNNNQNYTHNNNKLNDGNTKEDNSKKDTMYYYSIPVSDTSKSISDAKDVWYFRENSNNYSKGAEGETLTNKRAEVLASFEKLSSYAPSADEIKDDGTSYGYVSGTGEKVYDYFNNEYYKQQQRAMVDELKEKTKVVAQTGIINTQIERDRGETEYDFEQRDTKTLSYTIDNINLGITERPKSQLKINKEVSNYKFTLQNGQELFNAQKEVKDLSYSQHRPHSEVKENGMFVGIPRVSRPGDGINELIENYVDNEMLNDATVNITYKITVENISETDYKDLEFYYTGKESNKDENISKTEAAGIVDYVANTIGFSQEGQTHWRTSSKDELMPSVDSSNENANYVNRLYAPELSTYLTVLSTNALNGKLKPGEKKDTTLKLSTNTANNLGNNNLVYNNMVEIIAISNDVGRRCAFSIPGNEEMADQKIGNNGATKTKTSLTRIEVNEVDADSAQLVKIIPPITK